MHDIGVSENVKSLIVDNLVLFWEPHYRRANFSITILFSRDCQRYFCL